MVAVEDLDAGAGIGGDERIRRPSAASTRTPRSTGPATISLPSTNAMSVIDVGARIAAPVGVGRRVRQRDLACTSRLSSAIGSILPAPSTRSSAGFASAPCAAHHRDERVLRLRMHREIGDGDRRRVGAEQRGDLLIDRGDVGRAGLAARAPARRGRARRSSAALLSAANSMPSGPNVSGPTDCSAGPWSGAAAVTGVRADAAANTMATPAMTAAPFNAFKFMHCLLAAAYSTPLSEGLRRDRDTQRASAASEPRERSAPAKRRAESV